MANSKSLFSSFFIHFTLISALVAATEPPFFSRSLSPKSLGHLEEKLTHLHFYFHEVVSGPKPSVLKITDPHKTNTGLPFGTSMMIDDPLTLEPDVGSKLVGRAQGLYASANQEEMGLMMVMVLGFTEGEYKGSTITVLGRNLVQHTVRELPIIGGTGVFRFARGYAQARSVKVDWEVGDAVVEYNVYVVHYLTEKQDLVAEHECAGATA